MASSTPEYDYVIVGGGTAGCVLASRLREAFPKLSIALIEAGNDDRDSPNVTDPLKIRALLEGPTCYQYSSVPQKQLEGAQISTVTGRTLGGSSVVNFCGWTRGHASDFDAWGQLVQDARWSYQGLLPFFKKSETHPNSINPEQHGHDGPIRATVMETSFRLREPLKAAFKEIGVDENDDMNSGSPSGLATVLMSRADGLRQHAANKYDLANIEVMTNTLAHKVLVDQESKTATGVQLSNGTVLRAKEVIVSCGAMRSPHLLLHSGIGPAAQLQKHGISQVVDLPVGEGLHDHPSIDLQWRLAHPERGLAVGSPLFENLSGAAPMDWMYQDAASDAELEKAAKVDGNAFRQGPRIDFEVPILYMPSLVGAAQSLPMDGSYMTTGIVCLSTTSRGSITLASSNPEDGPVYDPHFFSTEHDKAVVRSGMRATARALLTTKAGEDIVAEEVVAPGQKAISPDSTDDELNERIGAYTKGLYHFAGTAAMGSVVNTDCTVKGVKGLRVVDASIMPISVTAHIQAAVYAVAERAADIMVNSRAP